jgi:hypothetical protein
MNNQLKYRNINSWFLFILTLVLTAFFSFSNLSEFIEVAILKQTKAYPFGGEGTTPWYYKSARHYSSYMLVFGIGFIITMVFSIMAFLKFKKTQISVAFLITLILISLQLINAQSE